MDENFHIQLHMKHKPLLHNKTPYIELHILVVQIASSITLGILT